MDPILVDVDEKSDPDFYIVTTKVPKAGVKDGIRRVEILAQANALNTGIHTVEQIPLTDAELQASEDYTEKQKREFLASRAAVNWNGIPVKIGKKIVLPAPAEEIIPDAEPAPKTK